jgi:hypothetical protein
MTGVSAQAITSQNADNLTCEERILKILNEVYYYERSLEYVRTLYPVLGEYDSRK